MTNPAKALARAVAKNDTVLAHINPDEARMLARHYGMSINPETGLPQFGLFSGLGKIVGGLFGGGGGGGGKGYLKDIQKQVQPLLDEGKAELSQFQTGQLRPADQISLAQGEKAKEAALQSYYSRAGLGDSASLANELGNVDQQAVIQRQQLSDQYLRNSLSLYQTALGPYSGAAQALFQNAQQNQSAGIGALGSILGTVAGGPVGGAIGGFFSDLFGGGGGGSSGGGGLLGSGGIGGEFVSAFG